MNPLEYAQGLKTRAGADVTAATKTLQEHSQRKEAPSEGIRKAVAELRAAEAARTQAEAKLAARTEALATKRDARDIQRAEAAKAGAGAHLAETSKKVQAALENTAFTSPEGREALETERKLMEIRSMLVNAQAAAKEAQRRVSPVSILVSKKDKKVYIRQALAPVWRHPRRSVTPKRRLARTSISRRRVTANLSGGPWSHSPRGPKVLTKQARGDTEMRVGKRRPPPSTPRSLKSDPGSGACRVPSRGFGANFRAIVDRRLAHHYR